MAAGVELLRSMVAALPIVNFSMVNGEWDYEIDSSNRDKKFLLNEKL
jgi:hypothetical protein